MTPTTAKQKRYLSADDYDAIVQIMHIVPEGPETSAETLKWNSAIRDLRAKFEHQFGRG